MSGSGLIRIRSISVDKETHERISECRKYCIRKGIDNLPEPYNKEINKAEIKELIKIAIKLLEKELKK